MAVLPLDYKTVLEKPGPGRRSNCFQNNDFSTTDRDSIVMSLCLRCHVKSLVFCVYLTTDKEEIIKSKMNIIYKIRHFSKRFPQQIYIETLYQNPTTRGRKKYGMKNSTIHPFHNAICYSEEQ